MASALETQFATITPRARVGLLVLALIGIFVIFDWGGRLVQDQELENLAIKRQLTELQNLRTDGDLERQTIDAEARWQAYDTLLLQDTTEGLNIASLQSAIVATLNACGLEQVLADVDAAPADDLGPWQAYTVEVRARDIYNVFPVCLVRLAELDTGIVVSDIVWRRGSNIQITLNAYSAAMGPVEE